MARHNEIGRWGEEIACEWLKNHGYSIVEQNYRKKFGEIDIVARGMGKVRFIEVKTVSYETKAALAYAVSHETWRPEEKVHKEKQRRLKNAIEAWRSERSHAEAFEIDILAVRLVPAEKYATIKLLPNVIFE